MSEHQPPREPERRAPRSLLAGLRRVRLRPSPDDGGQAPPAGQTAAGGPSRYELHGEVGRGGMGVVLRGVDVELGRDVALKIMDKELADRPDVLQRFIEEAQIGGQLQHPGIVPVYELGLMADERPFISMKLVKGRTLAKLLAGRGVDDTRRLIEIFASVCQTLAYAHSRGVIHRDVKPANVMVGAFGEVQLMDWGLAKVLDARESAAPPDRSLIRTVRTGPDSDGPRSELGAVMGTPNYMSPEQARGEIDRVDERSDVFALGAMLCEILTGKPPYAEAAGVLAAAAGGLLDPARARLQECGSDPELVALAVECLAPAAADRPADAGVVARRVLGHLASVEERARRAQVDAAEARVKAAGERRARHLTVALAASVLATVLLGGGTWLWLARRTAERGRQAEADIAAALAEAAHERGAQHWSEALGAAERARGVAASGAVSAEAAQRAEHDAGAIVAQIRADRDHDELIRDNAALLAELDDMRQVSLRLYPDDVEQSETELSRTLARHGLGLDPSRLAVEDALAAWTARGLPIELAAALDAWAQLRLRLGDEDGGQGLHELALALDPDPVRSAIRNSPTRETLLALAAAPTADALPAATQSVLGANLSLLGESEAAAALLARAALQHPGDYPLAVSCGTALRLLEPPRLGEAAQAFRAAMALRPDSVAAVDQLARTLDLLGERQQALDTLQAALARLPEDARLHAQLARILGLAGHGAEAEAEARAALALQPDLAAALHTLSILLLERGDVAGGLDAAQRAVAASPNDAKMHFDLGRALVARGERDAAIAAYRRSLELDPDLSATHNNLGGLLNARGEHAAALAERRRAVELDPGNANAVASLAWVLAMCPDASLRDPEQAEHWARVGVELTPDIANAWNNLGAALCRAGKWDEAVQALQRSLDLCDDSADEAYIAAIDHALLALVRARQGDVPAARAEVEQARAGLQRAPTGDLARILAEAGAAIDAASAPKP